MKTVSKFTLFVGLEDKDSKTQIIPTASAVRRVSRLVVDRFGFGTVLAGARGVYSYTGGGIASENTVIVILYGVDRAAVLAFVEDLKKALNQESIGLEASRVSFDCL